MPTKPHSMLADLDHDEGALQSYAAVLRGYTFRVLDGANAALCDRIVAPE